MLLSGPTIASAQDTDSDGMPDEWEWQFFGGPTNAAAHHDADLDGICNLDEYIADTVPTNAASFLAVTRVLKPDSLHTEVHFLSSAERIYSLEYTAGLLAGTWQIVGAASDKEGVGGPDAFTDENGDAAPRFYRIRVALPPPPVPGGNGCDLYPIALHQAMLDGVAEGEQVNDILNTSRPGNIGWLTWTGDTSVPALAQSLTLPGDSDTYVNPADAEDHEVSVGDAVRGSPGVKNAADVRAALDALIGQEIVVPTWDICTGQGSGALYHVTGFARVQITFYHLPAQNRITAIYLGPASCGE